MKAKTAKLIDRRDYFEQRQREVAEARAGGELRLDSLRLRAEMRRPRAPGAPRRTGGNAA
jgi:hypothetical protein